MLRVPVEVWVRKADRALRDSGIQVRVERLLGEHSDGSEDTEEVSDLTNLKNTPGTYRLLELNEDGDCKRVLSECRVGARGERLSGSPDPLTVTARNMSMLSEGWAQLNQAHSNVVHELKDELKALSKERDHWKESYQNLLIASKDDDKESHLYGLLQHALDAYLVHDRTESVRKFASDKLMPKLTDEQKKVLVPLLEGLLKETKTDDLKQLAASALATKEEEPLS